MRSVWIHFTLASLSPPLLTLLSISAPTIECAVGYLPLSLHRAFRLYWFMVISIAPSLALRSTDLPHHPPSLLPAARSRILTKVSIVKMKIATNQTRTGAPYASAAQRIHCEPLQDALVK